MGDGLQKQGAVGKDGSSGQCSITAGMSNDTCDDSLARSKQALLIEHNFSAFVQHNTTGIGAAANVCKIQ